MNPAKQRINAYLIRHKSKQAELSESRGYAISEQAFREHFVSNSGSAPIRVTRSL